ncbi:VQ motif-containing protein 9-like [Ananas comosus]|uniref:VQ motif-containing protein 9-like n=1 Tax=Ananas comosus TaxID=4615 RepID=A0A6P5FR45_ANACO|nr:VQ motif-containing protein 9-like [Ananas comosus]
MQEKWRRALIPPPPPQQQLLRGRGGGAPPLQPQPPVYNIDKSDFRDVVQKLTGSPAHHQIRPPQPPPAPAPAPASAPPSRLHRIRPPPLAHLSPRPQAPPLAPLAPPIVPAGEPWTRPPLSPLPPLPAVSAAAESPISAYMRRLRAGGAGAGIPALGPFPAAPPGAPALPPPPSSPLGFGCLSSPRTAYQMMMAPPGLLTPSSPGVPMPSPRLGEP